MAPSPMGPLGIAGDRIAFVGDRAKPSPGPPERLAAVVHDGGGGLG